MLIFDLMLLDLMNAVYILYDFCDFVLNDVHATKFAFYYFLRFPYFFLLYVIEFNSYEVMIVAVISTE